MNMKHCELDGQDLSDAVARYLGWTKERPIINGVQHGLCWWPKDFGDPKKPRAGATASARPRFCSSAEEAWEIIFQYRIHLNPLVNDSGEWEAFVDGSAASHKNPFVAAMRAFLDSRLAS